MIDEIYLQCDSCEYDVKVNRATWEQESINPDCPLCLDGFLVC